MDVDRVLVVADDLTGAVDTGHELAARGCPTVVSTDTTPRGDTAARAVTTASRRDDPTTAAATVADVVQGAPPATRLYKKVDSTLRGNPVAEVDAALAATDRAVAAVAPASPGTDRVTAAGHQLAAGRLVTDPPVAGGLEASIETAHIPTAFAAGQHLVSHVGVETVARGADELATALDDGVVCCDAVHESHLATVGEAVDEETLLVGAAGLARHWRLPETTAGPPAVETPGPRPLAVVGSLAPATLEQVSRLPAQRRVELDVETAVIDPERAGREAGTTAAALLADGSGSGAAVVSATECADAERSRGAGVDEQTARERVEAALASAARVAVADAAPSALLLSGGAVAAAVLAALDARAITLAGRAVEPGVPVGRILGGEAAGRPVVTKAGGFGTPALLAAWVAAR